MKRALYYAVRVNTYRAHVVAVTLEKGSRWYGRRLAYDEPTNGTLDQLRGRFETAERAVNRLDEIAAIVSAYKTKRSSHNDAIRKLHREEREAIDALFADKKDA